MAKIVGVKFDNDINTYYFNDNGLNLKVNITVIADTNRGLQFGKVISLNEVEDVDFKVEENVVRVSSKKDYFQYLSNLKDAKIAIDTCKKLVEELGLSMSIIDANYNFDRSQLLFRFVADTRVDFRQLARDLGSMFRTRIELRQIGIRDKAKEVSGVGPCGRKLCCSSFLNEFDSVSINMAKNQAISLNPSKINGVCGRLLCCLKYENDNYSELRKNIPDVGKTYSGNGVSGKVVAVDILKRVISVQTSNNNVVKVKIEDDSEE